MPFLRAATRNPSPESSVQSKDFNLKRVLFCRGNHGRLFQHNRPVGDIRPSITKLLDVVVLAHTLDVNSEPMDCLITITKELRALETGSLMRVGFKDRIEARRYWSSPTVFNPSLTTTVRSRSTKSFTCWFLPVPLRESRFMPTR